MSTTRPTIALLGDDRGNQSHRELNALVPRLLDEMGVVATWVPTGSAFDVREYAGVWLVPGSPYEDDDAVFSAVRQVRESGIPFMGVCGGMQYAVIEFTRHVIGTTATHAESDGLADENVVAALACSLNGKERTVEPVADTRFASWVKQPFVGMHFCNYAPTPSALARLEEFGVVVGATALDAGAEVLEFPNHPFFVTSMFQPHIGASVGAPIHPLIREFVAAATRHERATS